VSLELDGSVRIDWDAEGYRQIRVIGPHRELTDLLEFASGVADLALLNRSLHSLRVALRERYDGTFDLDGRASRGRAAEPHILVRMHPPPGEPNPDPDV
jgi:hypothetical protein